jgi:hypothetical protein
MSSLTTWQMQMGAPVTRLLKPSQHAAAGASTLALVRKSAQGISLETEV